MKNVIVTSIAILLLSGAVTAQQAKPSCINR